MHVAITRLDTDFRPGSINNSGTTSLKPTLDLIRVFDLTYVKKDLESVLIFLAIVLSKFLLANLTALLALLACFLYFNSIASSLLSRHFFQRGWISLVLNLNPINNPKYMPLSYVNCNLHYAIKDIRSSHQPDNLILPRNVSPVCYVHSFRQSELISMKMSDTVSISIQLLLHNCVIPLIRYLIKYVVLVRLSFYYNMI